MALALETDFRSGLTTAAPESASRKAPDGGSGGEDFARNLKHIREAETSPAESLATEATPAPYIPLPIPAGLEVFSGTTVEPASSDAALASFSPVAAALPEQALVTPQLAATPKLPVVSNTLPVSMELSEEAPLPEAIASDHPVAITEAPVRLTEPYISPASRPVAEPSAAPATPSRTSPDQGALAMAANIVLPPALVKPGNQTGRIQVIGSVDAAGARLTQKLAPSGPVAMSPDAQAAIETVSSSAAGTIFSAIAEPATAPAWAGDLSGQPSSPGGVLGLAAPAPQAAPSVPSSPVPVQMTAANAVLIASPTGVVDIVSQAAEDGQSDRIVVQLDPPELGRVSIDFKFDAHGLQHVTITSETPEAMRQLRTMHADLVQALERQGIAGQNMTFQHQQQNPQQAPAPNPFSRSPTLASSSDDSTSAAISAAESRQTARTLPGGRLDIRF